MSNEREALRRGDELLKKGDPLGAALYYAEVARMYEREGFALKSVAVWKQIRTALAHVAQGAELEAEARAALVRLYRSLGLEADAKAIEAERNALT